MATKKEMLAAEIAKAVGAGKAVELPTVDFNDPNRPKTCLEVDFPILPVNQVAVIEGNAGKPIYQMSKWWARRRSSVFRAMLIAAATKAPEDPSQAAKLVWDNYYANHQRKGAFKHLTVADIFMGGGTTLVEGSRLGMQMIGNDLNPVAWFVCKQELAQVDIEEVKRLLADIEAEVKPQIMPYYYCDGPNGEKGKWTHLPSKKLMGPDFDPLTIPWDKRKEYKYEGPEIIYTFWAKHGPCQMTGCGHRTPIMTSPVMAVKTLSVKYWERTCSSCRTDFDCEEKSARMAPDVPLYVAPTEKPFSLLHPKHGVQCPNCGVYQHASLGKGQTKKVELSLLVHPQWLAGAPSHDKKGRPHGGAVQDDAEATVRWNVERSATVRLLEVRGVLPEAVTCPETGVQIATGRTGGTVAKKSAFACNDCGNIQDILTSVTASGRRAVMAAYAIQGVSNSQEGRSAYGGRFFAPFTNSRQIDAVTREWETRREGDLSKYWPRVAVPEGFKTTYQKIPEHGYALFSDMFNSRQMLTLCLILKSLLETTSGKFSCAAREFVMGAFQQYLRNQNMLCLWNIQRDTIEPHFSNNNYYPKNTPVENCVFGTLGRGNWTSCTEGLIESLEWSVDPWELVPTERLKSLNPSLLGANTTKSVKAYPGDSPQGATLFCSSSTDLSQVEDASVDLVITDPPFGNNVQYAELADFFQVWLRIGLQSAYSEFVADLTPKALEAVDNPVRNADNSEGYYRQVLTAVWREASRIMKQTGILAFTFHHSEDAPWVAVLESLFEAGFYLETAYPIRSDETKGEGAKPGTFGSQTIEYDIIHVCRKRTEEPKPVSWGRMRREILGDVRQLQGLLANHAKEGVPAADLQVIRRGKALEYFSRHYGKVYVDEGRTLTVKDALAGINQLIDEDLQHVKEPPPVIAEPITRQFLRIFDGKNEVARDQMQKFLRGSGLAPDEFENRGWCSEKNKVFTLVAPLDFAKGWVSKHKHKLTYDLDQALVLIGACFEGSGINASDTLKNPNFKPHVALKPLLQWFEKHAAASDVKFAARKAVTLCNSSPLFKTQTTEQLDLFSDEAV